MARKPRIEFTGGVYHVISRGDRGKRFTRVSGGPSRVTNAVRKVDSGKESEIRRWKMQLEGNS